MRNILPSTPNKTKKGMDSDITELIPFIFTLDIFVTLTYTEQDELNLLLI